MKALFFKMALPLIGGIPFVSSAQQSVGKKNVLLIYFDDLRTELNCFGDSSIISPNIDQLAKEGVAFQRAYCNIPVSGASRASLLTGTRPTRNTFMTAKIYAEKDKKDKIALNDYLKSLGYHTEVRGKVFHHADDHEEGWTVRHKDSYSAYMNEKNGKKNEKGKGMPYECMDVPDDAYPDGLRVREAVKDLERLKKNDAPFFYAFGFAKPHLPFIAPKKYWDLYDGKVQLPDNYVLPDNHNIPARAFHRWGELRNYVGIPQEGPLPADYAKKLIQGYRACVTYVDAQLGILLDKVRELGLDKNTLIVLVGDHGWSLGEHGLWCKHTIFETMLRAPLIIYDYGSKLNGTDCDEVVEFVDVFPTICDAIGVEIPEQAEGQSLCGLLNDENAKSKGYAVCRWMQGYTLVTDDNLFYTEWWNGKDEIEECMLFDHNNDPDENFNIVTNEKYAERVREMGKQLKECRGIEFDKYKKNSDK